MSDKRDGLDALGAGAAEVDGGGQMGGRFTQDRQSGAPGSREFAALGTIRKPRTDSDLKSRAMAAIAANWRDWGSSRQDLVRENPEFAALIGAKTGEKGRRKFYRWLEQVKNPPPPDITKPHQGREAATDALRSATERARSAGERNLPAAPSPAYLARAGAEGVRNIDFLAEIHVIWADIARLRDHAMQPDETSPDGKCIADAKLFDASIQRRVRVIETAVGIMQEVWDLEFQQRFYEGITRILVDELASVPEIQERVIQKLTELNNTRGMTIHAEVM